MIVNPGTTTLGPAAPRPVGPSGKVSDGPNPGTDGFKPSAELLDPGQLGGAQLAQGIAGAQLDSILRGQANQLMVTAASGVGDVQSMAQQLMKDYQRAKETGAILSPETEELIKRALERVQGQGQGPEQQGGVSQVDALNAGGGNSPTVPASNGGAPTSGGGFNGNSLAGDGSSAGPSDSSQPFNNGSNGNAMAAAPAETNGTADSSATPEVDAAQECEEKFDNVTQGTPNNCGATSLAKQMQQQWGADAMRMDNMPDGTVKVTMRDGYTTSLTQEQIQQAGAATDYSGDDAAAREQANRMNAAASSRYADENNTTYEEGLNAINGRNWPDQIAQYYGVQANPVDPKTLDDNGYAIVANEEHATNVMRADDGKVYEDDHGEIPQDAKGDPVRYNGDVYSNGTNTGGAEKAWVLGDVGQPGAGNDKVPGVKLSDLESQGFLKTSRSSPSAPGSGLQPASPRVPATAPKSATTNPRGSSSARPTGPTRPVGSPSTTPVKSTPKTGSPSKKPGKS